MRERAAAVLPPEVLAYYDGWSGDGQSHDEATGAWRAHRFRPHVLSGRAGASARARVLGHDLALPVLAGPCALHGLAHPEGERATVAGVVAAGSLPVVSMRASVALQDMGLPPGGWWQQLYVLRDRGLTREVVARARDLGAAALVVTGDAPVLARRRASKETLRPDLLRAAPGVPARPGGELAADATLEEALGLAGGLPLLVKGVLRADDAGRCVDAGAVGVVVSNHGGRQLDGAVASAEALPEVVEAVAGRAAVLVDGGVRTGRDVVTALALGADAVLLGRPVLWAVAVDGAAGVQALLEDLREQVEEVLQLLGVPAPEGVTRDLLRG